MNFFASHCLSQLRYSPTKDQIIMMEKLETFLLNSASNALFVLKGSAGTGKTTLLSLLVNNLQLIGLKSVLLAPTGRAAKVMSNYSGLKAATIHRKIYSRRSLSEEPDFRLNVNTHTDTIFITDEASMIADVSADGLFRGRNLLEDIISFVYSGKGCKLIFSGDLAQLPPVGYLLSPALDEKYLSASFNLSVDSFVLNEVVRQDARSGVLINAENLRKKLMDDNIDLPFFDTENHPDITNISGNEIAEELNSFCRYGELDDTIIITRSNKMANLYNREIRSRILYRENELDAGDYLIVLKNNYFWLPKESTAGFIANGDIIQIKKVKRVEELYGMRFADICVDLPDYPDDNELEIKVILNTLTAEQTSLAKDVQNAFYQEILKDYEEIQSKREKADEIRKNPYYNALQIKFAYAMTCHKTQGGQWKNVFVDQGFVKDEQIDKEYIRWLYTAITRASEKVYLVNFNEKFFK